MLIDDAKPRIVPRKRRTMRDRAQEMAQLRAQRAALERAFARLLGGNAANAALADLLAPRDDAQVH